MVCDGGEWSNDHGQGMSRPLFEIQARFDCKASAFAVLMSNPRNGFKPTQWCPCQVNKICICNLPGWMPSITVGWLDFESWSSPCECTAGWLKHHVFDIEDTGWISTPLTPPFIVETPPWDRRFHGGCRGHLYFWCWPLFIVLLLFLWWKLPRRRWTEPSLVGGCKANAQTENTWSHRLNY